MTITNKSYAINLWGSHPDADNDDCWTGVEFDSLVDARAAFGDPLLIEDLYFHNQRNDSSSVWIELALFENDARPSVETLATRRLRRDHKPSDDSDWRHEMAREAGMLHGVEAYNDEMGWS